jgi:hypothetical protein
MAGYSRMVTLTSGTVDFLKQEKQVNLEYVYDGMRVGKFDKEVDFVAEKIAEYNKKEAGRGERWHKSWISDRTERFQPKFQDLLSRYWSEKKNGPQVGSFKDAKYTLILKTTMTDTGWNVGVMRRPAYINAQAIFVETQNRSNVLAVLTITKSPGNTTWGNDYDTGERMQESYAKAGKELGAFLSKKIK